MVNVYKIDNKKLFKYVLLNMLIVFIVAFVFIFLIYPLLDIGENRIIVSFGIGIAFSLVSLFDLSYTKKRRVIVEDNRIIYDYHAVEGRRDDNRYVNKKYIIYKVDTIKITPMFIKVTGKINAPKNRVEISRIFEKEDEIINSLEKFKQ